MDVVWDWIASAAERADWIAVLGSFVATFLAAWLAAVIALRTQRADFERRADELLHQSAADAAARAEDWRRATLTRALNVVDDAARHGLDPYLAGADRVTNAAESMRMEFRLDPRGDGGHVGDWFVNQVRFILAAGQQAALGTREGTISGLTAQVRQELAEWAEGKTRNVDFTAK